MLVIVTGAPRSGTSLMMQMLVAAGLPVHQDDRRLADTSNPRGYLELERVKSLPGNSRALDDLESGAVKVIYALAYFLPANRRYKFLVMEREPGEILASQSAMLQGQSVPAMTVDELRDELEEFRHWVQTQSNIEHLFVAHRDLVQRRGIEAVARFIGAPEKSAEMADCVRPELWRQRR
ncbi:MAG: sulfotransferase family protein [Myxococcota bacterium]